MLFKSSFESKDWQIKSRIATFTRTVTTNAFLYLLAIAIAANQAMNSTNSQIKTALHYHQVTRFVTAKNRRTRACRARLRNVWIEKILNIFITISLSQSHHRRFCCVHVDDFSLGQCPMILSIKCSVKHYESSDINFRSMFKCFAHD